MKESLNIDAFRAAAANGNMASVEKFLKEHVSHINEKNHNGWTALMRATANGHHDIAALLLEKGAALNIQNNDGKTALILAAEKNCQNTLSLLLEKGADTDKKNAYGETALMRAASRNFQDIVILLLEAGASVDEKDNIGRTALEHATHNLHTASAVLLEKHADIRHNAETRKKAKLLEDLADISTNITDGTSRPLPYKGPLRPPSQGNKKCP